MRPQWGTLLDSVEKELQNPTSKAQLKDVRTLLTGVLLVAGPSYQTRATSLMEALNALPLDSYPNVLRKVGVAIPFILPDPPPPEPPET